MNPPAQMDASSPPRVNVDIWHRITSSEALALTSIAALSLVTRLWQLNSIPGEMWGDVIEHHRLASQILQGHFFLDYAFGGDGSMFSYLLAAVAHFIGLTFFAEKLTTVLAGAALSVVVYLLARELFAEIRIAYMSGILAAVSFWSITFSRQGKPYILAALFVALTALFALRKQRLLAGLMFGLGMYTQATFWGMAIATLVSPVIFATGLIVALPVILTFVRSPGTYFGSGTYLGDKLHGSTHTSVFDILSRILDNAYKNALSFNVRGDITFRHNIVGHPHLDFLSGLLFDLGFLLIVIKTIRERRRDLLFWFIVPFVLVQIPSVLDSDPLNVPAMGRMIGVIPFVFIAIAYALEWIVSRVSAALRSPRLPPNTMHAFGVAIPLLLIAAINANNYFVVYPQGLPNNNTPFGNTIARRIDAYPGSTLFYVLGCCWAQWGQPEPEAISYVLDQPRDVQFALDDRSLLRLLATIPSHSFVGGRVVLIENPNLLAAPSGIDRYLRITKGYILRRNNWDIAWFFEARYHPQLLAGKARTTSQDLRRRLHTISSQVAVPVGAAPLCRPGRPQSTVAMSWTVAVAETGTHLPRKTGIG